MSKKNCELCNKPARMFCESDQASLCFPCDEKVHAANFLVAKHSRTLLCHVCRSPTPWSAHGTRLGPTVSVCHSCSRRGGGDTSVAGDNVTTCSVDATSTSNSTTLHEDDGGSHSGEDSEYDDDSDGYSEEEEEEEEEEEGENQVVPGSEEDGTWQSGGGGGGGPEMNENDSCLGSKRTHDGRCTSHHGETSCSSHEMIKSLVEESDECSHDSLAFRPSKIRKKKKGTRSFFN